MDAQEPYRLYSFFEFVNGQGRSEALLTHALQKQRLENCTGNAGLLNDLAPAGITSRPAIQPPTPQEQQVEDWLKVKHPCSTRSGNSQRDCRSGRIT